MNERPKRIQRKRTRGWRMPEGAVPVSRPSKWGNPFDFRREAYCWTALTFGCRGDPAGRREAAVRAYRDWIDPPHGRQTLHWREQPAFGNAEKTVPIGPAIEAGAAPSREDIRRELRGKDLACWCRLCPAHADGKPIGTVCEACQPCHADVLLELANGGGVGQHIKEAAE